MIEDKEMKKLAEAVKTIKAQYKDRVIKEHSIKPTVNVTTCEKTGYAVTLQLSTAYDYEEEVLNGWKKLLQADYYYIRVMRNQLHVTFRKQIRL